MAISHRFRLDALALLLGIVGVSLLPCFSFAQSPVPAYFGVQVSPPVPPAQNSFPIQINATLVNTPANITQVTVTQDGNVIDVNVYVDHLNGQIFPQPIQVNETAPLLAAGTYTFRYVEFDRNVFSSNDYFPPVVHSALTVTVADPSIVATAVEYYYAQRDHYFMTANPVEIAALDGGVFPGWVRTGQQFLVYQSDPASPGNSLLSPVCRFYGLPSVGLDSHFFSASPGECAAVAARWPDAWLLETSTAFYVFLPEPQYAYPLDPGACPFGTQPLYRLFNNRADINHRYTTSLTIRQQMLDAGWLSEGYGSLGVAMCVNAS
jgi:hypothetical protein